jgi:hypothetical protein
MMPSMLPPYCMTMNQIKLEKRFHNGTVLVYQTFWRFINGFNDGQQDFQFFVNAADGQSDCITTDTNGGITWDAIWKSKAIITNFGWVVEMRIPYGSALFLRKKQTWVLIFGK